MEVSERARAARALAESRGFAVLSTVSKRVPGHPFGSTVNYALDDAGCPMFYFSSLAVHTKNLMGDPRASLTIYAEGAETDPLSSARMNIMGEIHAVAEEEAGAARAAYFARHPAAEQYMGFGDFRVFRMYVMDVYYVGGFGAMGWVAPGDFLAAS